LFAIYPQGMGAMASLNLANNGIGGYENDDYDFIATPEGIAILNPIVYTLQPFLVSSSLLTSGPAAIADAIKDMGTLTTLDISRNSIPSKQEGELQRICAAGDTELAI
jgi:hypothetical protein